MNLMMNFGKDHLEVSPYDFRTLSRIYTSPNALLFVVIYYWLCLGIIRIQAFVEYASIIVGALDQRFTSDIVLHGHLWRMKFSVIRSPTI